MRIQASSGRSRTGRRAASRHASRLCALVVGAIVGAVFVSPEATAHESDQFTLPLNKPFADLGGYLDTVHCRAIEEAVTELNRKIERALEISDPLDRARELERLHRPVQLVSEVYNRFNDAFFEVQNIEFAARSDWAKAMYGDDIRAYRTVNWIYTYTHFPLDPRRLVLFWQSSTIKAYGVYFGTDKLSHFHHMGRIYWETWAHLREEGMSEEEAVVEIVRRYSDGGPIGENGMLGYVPTGVYSNGDLVANYTGYKFFRNLLEPVVLKGEERPPMVVRVGPFYQINTHVRPESGFFGWFVSDHWNEALNPSKFEPSVRWSTRLMLEKRADRIVEFYTVVDGRPAEPSYYERLASDLSTYYGEAYGYWGDDVMTIANTCLPELEPMRVAELARLGEERRQMRFAEGDPIIASLGMRVEGPEDRAWPEAGLPATPVCPLMRLSPNGSGSGASGVPANTLEAP